METRAPPIKQGSCECFSIVYVLSLSQKEKKIPFILPAGALAQPQAITASPLTLHPQYSIDDPHPFRPRAARACCRHSRNFEMNRAGVCSHGECLRLLADAGLRGADSCCSWERRGTSHNLSEVGAPGTACLPSGHRLPRFAPQESQVPVS